MSRLRELIETLKQSVLGKTLMPEEVQSSPSTKGYFKRIGIDADEYYDKDLEDGGWAVLTRKGDQWSLYSIDSDTDKATKVGDGTYDQLHRKLVKGALTESTGQLQKSWFKKLPVGNGWTFVTGTYVSPRMLAAWSKNIGGRNFEVQVRRQSGGAGYFADYWVTCLGRTVNFGLSADFSSDPAEAEQKLVSFLGKSDQEVAAAVDKAGWCKG